MCELQCRSGSAHECMLVGANDGVGAQMSGPGYRSVNLKIMWPGYEHLNYTYPLDIYTPAGPVTRRKLATQVTQAFTYFIRETKKHRPGPNGASWPLGDSAIGLNHLILSALWNVHDDVWMAEVIVDFR